MKPTAPAPFVVCSAGAEPVAVPVTDPVPPDVNVKVEVDVAFADGPTAVEFAYGGTLTNLVELMGAVTEPVPGRTYPPVHVVSSVGAAVSTGVAVPDVTV